MKKCVILLAGMIVSFSACRKTSFSEPEIPKQDETVLTAEEAERFVLLNTDYVLSKADILKKAQVVAEVLGRTELKTKTGKICRQSIIADSIVATVPLTKSDGTITVVPKIYVVAFGQDAGFALFAGDKRIHEVLAFSGEGNYSSDDLHPGMEYFIQCLQTYMVSEIDRLEAMRGDSIYNRLVYKYGRFGDRSSVPQTRYPVWNGIEYVDMPVDNITEELYEYRSDPISSIIRIKTKWGQYWPYNIQVGAVYGADVPIGCVTTAVAQIMNYHKIGTNGNKTYLWEQFPIQAWNGISSEAINSISELCYDLGRPELLAVTYGVGGSSASGKHVTRTLNHYGYRAGTLVTYNRTVVNNNLLKGNPVYMQGIDDQANVAHAWIVDGVQMEEYYTVYRVNYWYEGHLQGSEYVNRNYQTLYTFQHVNWGWNGSYDCWVTPGIFDTRGGYNFNAALQMVCDIQPK